MCDIRNKTDLASVEIYKVVIKLADGLQQYHACCSGVKIETGRVKVRTRRTSLVCSPCRGPGTSLGGAATTR